MAVIFHTWKSERSLSVPAAAAVDQQTESGAMQSGRIEVCSRVHMFSAVFELSKRRRVHTCSNSLSSQYCVRYHSAWQRVALQRSQPIAPLALRRLWPVSCGVTDFIPHPATHLAIVIFASPRTLSAILASTLVAVFDVAVVRWDFSFLFPIASIRGVRMHMCTTPWSYKWMR